MQGVFPYSPWNDVYPNPKETFQVVAGVTVLATKRTVPVPHSVPTDPLRAYRPPQYRTEPKCVPFVLKLGTKGHVRHGVRHAKAGSVLRAVLTHVGIVRTYRIYGKTVRRRVRHGTMQNS